MRFFFWWAKGLSAKDIHKEIFAVYVGKCLPCKAVHNCVEKRLADEEFRNRGMEVADNSRKISILPVSTNLYSDGSSVLMLVEDISRNKCFSRLGYHMFYIHL
jgi:hypothetical protein